MTRVLLLVIPFSLAACTHMDPAEREEAHRSVELAAFQGADKTHGFRDARVVYDARQCALYQGTADDGQIRQVPLKNWEGAPLCRR